jgi:hypothetical protein
MVSQPMISMSQYQGPWPKCLGMSGGDCMSYIEENAKELRGKVVVIQPGTVLKNDFEKERVRVFIDNDGIVDAIPSRG